MVPLRSVLVRTWPWASTVICVFQAAAGGARGRVGIFGGGHDIVRIDGAARADRYAIDPRRGLVHAAGLHDRQAGHARRIIGIVGGLVGMWPELVLKILNRLRGTRPSIVEARLRHDAVGVGHIVLVARGIIAVTDDMNRARAARNRAWAGPSRAAIVADIDVGNRPIHSIKIGTGIGDAGGRTPVVVVPSAPVPLALARRSRVVVSITFSSAS